MARKQRVPKVDAKTIPSIAKPHSERKKCPLIFVIWHRARYAKINPIKPPTEHRRMSRKLFIPAILSGSSAGRNGIARGKFTDKPTLQAVWVTSG